MDAGAIEPTGELAIPTDPIDGPVAEAPEAAAAAVDAPAVKTPALDPAAMAEAEAAAAAANMVLPVGRSDDAPTPDELASLAAAVQAARPLVRPLVPAPAGATTDAPVAAPSTRRVSRARLRGGAARLVNLALAIALFVGGAAIGNALFVRAQPPPPVVGDVSTSGIATPAVVSELIKALASNDADALRSAVSGDPYRLLAGELQGWNLQGVTKVETLATMQDGPRTATEIVISGRTASGQPVVFNLVVHVTDGKIVNFR